MDFASEIVQLFDLVIAKLKNDRLFTQQLALQIEDIRFKTFLNKLALYKQNQEEVLATLKKECYKQRHLPSPEARENLKALVGCCCSKPEQEEPKANYQFKDKIRCLLLALKDNVAFYTGLKAFVCDKKSKQLVEELIREELTYLSQLYDLWEELLSFVTKN